MVVSPDRANLHQPLLIQHRYLCRKVKRHFVCYGITGNYYEALKSLVDQTQQIWVK